ncbi:MAG: bifunctional glutamate N-acetyltransferase/amino-acid acetyltransferase ArgJ [Armatimonadetes bacterium]|nr:bifunctional glutamate N-acetyltransferase/amino-acid acetyltransferase ArgJ [Armatimonadota bacterium]
MASQPPPFQVLEDGTLTSVPGIRATGVHCGVKKKNLDLALIYSEAPSVAAGTFTRNKVKGAAVVVCKENLKTPGIRAIVVNSGNANTCTGETGLENARRMVHLAAEVLSVRPEEVLVSSTGIIGKPLPMDRIEQGLRHAGKTLNVWGDLRGFDFVEQGHLAARAIMTTDAYPKEVAVRLKFGRKTVTLAGICKGAGMIAPNMATMLCYLATDAAIPPALLKPLLKEAVDRSFNSISVDGDTSTSDTVILLSNGLAGNAPLEPGSKEHEKFREALAFVTRTLAQKIVRDGEGATKLIEIHVTGAMATEEAHQVGMTVANSVLWKCAVFGGDPNWGRIAASAGRSPARVKQERLCIYIGDQQVFRLGEVGEYDLSKAEEDMKGEKVCVRVDLGMGEAEWTVWGSDLTYDYVKLNAEYHT